MKNPIDLHIGLRIRHRRWLENWTQQDLAKAVGVRFQQIQKYEKGDNRVCASRLWDLAKALGVSVSYFYEGLEQSAVHHDEGLLEHKETADLMRAYYAMAERPRRSFLELAMAVGHNVAQQQTGANLVSMSSSKSAA
jgi:transcriptional regulator with XRE-family HTH domain